MVWSILHAADLHPDRVRYYCERRDPDFEGKMHEVLVACQQLSFRFDDDGDLLPWEGEEPEVHVVSVDEKPGIQALSPTGEDLRPTPGVRGGAVTRDHEYRRRGTPALLAGIDLQDGTVEGVVRERHRSREFVELLEALDAKYPKGHVIRLVLDIRVRSLDELRERIELYLKEVNARPVPHRWTWGIGERAAEAERVMQSS